MKTGILGGTFNPIHYTHLLLGKQAKEQFGLDKLIFMPSARPSYKKGIYIAPFEERLEMTKLGVTEYLGGEEKGYYISALENERPGNTYTCDTMMIVKEMEPDTDFYFIIGGDSLMYIETWKSPEIIATKTKLLVAERNDACFPELSDKADELRAKYGFDITFIKHDIVKTSSTEIRRKLREHVADIPEIPSSVREYVERKHLYDSDEVR